MKKWLLIVVGLVVVLVVGFGLYARTLSDLRTPHLLKVGLTEAGRTRGHALLRESIEKMGGVARWKTLRKEIMRFSFRDVWFSRLLQMTFMPLEFSGQVLHMTFRPFKEDSRMVFVNGKRKDTAWGIQQWRTYKVDAKGKITWKQSSSLKFWLPTYQYFFLMPYFLYDAEIAVDAGNQTLNGKEYARVLVSWKSIQPQRTIDQYLVWIELKSKRIAFVQYSVRDVMGGALGTVHFSEYRNALGLFIPFRFAIVQDIKAPDKKVHEVTVDKVELLPSLPSTYLIPDPQRSASK